MHQVEFVNLLKSLILSLFPSLLFLVLVSFSFRVTVSAYAFGFFGNFMFSYVVQLQLQSLMCYVRSTSEWVSQTWSLRGDAQTCPVKSHCVSRFHFDDLAQFELRFGFFIAQFFVLIIKMVNKTTHNNTQMTPNAIYHSHNRITIITANSIALFCVVVQNALLHNNAMKCASAQ